MTWNDSHRCKRQSIDCSRLCIDGYSTEENMTNDLAINLRNKCNFDEATIT